MIDKIRDKVEEAREEADKCGAMEERADLWNEGAEDAEDDIGTRSGDHVQYFPLR